MASFPAPEAGLVISYSYLWRDEAEVGHVEGRKARPCAIVLCVVQPEDQMKHVYVVPITHRAPARPDAAIEIPLSIKRHLGLDDDPSWVIVDEVNTFAWPGFDLRPIRGSKDRYVYGFLPPRFFRILLERFEQLRKEQAPDPTERG